MLAAQVDARKHDKLRIILGFDWSSWGLGLCEALLGWMLVAAAAAGRGFGRFWTEFTIKPSVTVPAPSVSCSPHSCPQGGVSICGSRIRARGSGDSNLTAAVAGGLKPLSECVCYL